MAIPDFQSVMLPLVKILGDGQERTMREVTDLLAESFHLTDQEREELLPSGQQSLFSNRVGWAKSHLKAAGLLENPVRGRVRISDLGRQVLAEKPPAINVKFLKRFPAYCDFIGKSAPTLMLIVTHKFDPIVPCVRIDTMRQTLRPEHVRLGDKRLDARFLKIVDDFSNDPTASIPEASGGWAASKAAYRFFDNPAVRPEDIRDALRRDALEYLPPDGPILAIQDTTSLDFTDHPATAGLGYMEHPKHSGLFMHSVLAATPAGVPCGHHRPADLGPRCGRAGQASARRKKATAEKESRRWLDALAATEAALPEGREVITVADREADIYDLFAHPRRPGSHLLIRVKPARGVRHPERLLGPAVRSGPVRGTMAVDLHRADDRPPRRAILTIRYLAPGGGPAGQPGRPRRPAVCGVDGDPGRGGGSRRRARRRCGGGW